MQLQLNGGNFFFRFGKYIRIAYVLLGFVLVAWKFDESFSFLESIGVGLYVAGSVALVISAQKVRGNYSITKSDKAKTIKDVLWIAVCLGGAFVVIIIGGIVNPKTQGGFMFVEVPIFILIFIIVALSARISYTLLLKRYFSGKSGGE